MRVGGTYRVVIPSNLAYGEKGINGVVPGNAALTFTVHLLSIR
jgi:FKBP-type peptidyl-prolyl cis-trans isomerase